MLNKWFADSRTANEAKQSKKKRENQRACSIASNDFITETQVFGGKVEEMWIKWWKKGWWFRFKSKTNKQTHAHQEYVPFITNYIPKVVVCDGKVTRKMQRNHIKMWRWQSKIRDKRLYIRFKLNMYSNNTNTHIVRKRKREE